MTQDEYIKELRKLYDLAVKNHDISLASELLDRIYRKE